MLTYTRIVAEEGGGRIFSGCFMKKENFVVRGKSYYLGLRNKYLNAAKEATSSGDRVLSEYNLQYAEHYGRVISEKFGSIMNHSEEDKTLPVDDLK
jgi:hypothetical protein